MSMFSRMASTNEQESAIRRIERWVRACNGKLCGGTTIGKSPQTVILDRKYQDSAIYINSDGRVEVYGNCVINLAGYRAVVTSARDNADAKTL